MNNAPRIGGPGRIHDTTAWLVRRIAAVWVAAWMGMIAIVVALTMVALQSPNAFESAPPDSYVQAAKQAGEPLARELARYQAAQISGEMLSFWGWVQLGLAAALFGVLLLLSSVGKVELGLSLAMAADAVLLKFLLIPGMDQFTRQVTSGDAAKRLAALSGHYQMAATSFYVSQSVTLVLGGILLVLLLRRSRARHA
jgi:hypothetical protein